MGWIQTKVIQSTISSGTEHSCLPAICQQPPDLPEMLSPGLGDPQETHKRQIGGLQQV